MQEISRRGLLLGGLAFAGSGALAACSNQVRLGMMNMTQMTHPMSALTVDPPADNPGNWVTHCHNIHHAEAGMMIALNYRV